MTVLKRVEKMEVALLQLHREMDDRTALLAGKLSGLEQAVASLGKTLVALSEELTSTKVLDSKAVLTRLRDVEDNNSKIRVDSMLAAGYLEEANTVEEDSLVVVSHTVTQADGTVYTTSNFTVVSMLSGAADQHFKELALGKSTGDVFKGEEDESGYEEYKLVHVFKLANKTVTAEDVP